MTEADPAAVVRRTHAPEQTEALGAALAPALVPGDLLLIEGPLGAGKTRFVAGLAHGLNAGGRVRSPSFTLVNEYPAGERTLYHLDLYRLDAVDAFGLGLEEMLERGVVAIEWGDRLPPAEGTEALELAFAVEGESTRSITARGRGPRGLELLRRWGAIEAVAR